MSCNGEETVCKGLVRAIVAVEDADQQNLNRLWFVNYLAVGSANVAFRIQIEKSVLCVTELRSLVLRAIDPEPRCDLVLLRFVRCRLSKNPTVAHGYARVNVGSEGKTMRKLHARPFPLRARVRACYVSLDTIVR